MPAFHTKTIECILSPVAEQTSRLVLIHEDAEHGRAIPDLTQPVTAVRSAVVNLVAIARSMLERSGDELLRHDMPPALRRVEVAADHLQEAALLLRQDPFSATARKRLIEGARGILQGTNAVLLVQDQSEVRRIVRTCKSVLEFLAVTEVVDSFEDLGNFIKNITPGLTNMAQQVDKRAAELTHKRLRDSLHRALNTVRSLTPALISAIKIFITARQQGGSGLEESRASRDYLVGRMLHEIHDIIRVLQLTGCDDDGEDDQQRLRNARQAIETRQADASYWLQTPAAPSGSTGETGLRELLLQARKIAELTESGDELHRLANEIETLLNSLTAMRQQGLGDSPHAVSIARNIHVKLDELVQRCAAIVGDADNSSRPSRTLSGQFSQAHHWLNKPADSQGRGLGVLATRSLAAESRRYGYYQHPGTPLQRDLFRLADEVEQLSGRMHHLAATGHMERSGECQQLAYDLAQTLNHLRPAMHEALIRQVADNFLDTLGPLKQLEKAALAPYTVPIRVEEFNARSAAFEAHSANLSRTGEMVTLAGLAPERRSGEDGSVRELAQELASLAKEVANVGRVVLLQADSPAARENSDHMKAAREHFDHMKSAWAEKADKLRELVDAACDSGALIRAQEEGILGDTDRTEAAIRSASGPAVVEGTAAIARRANRVVQVAELEASNSADRGYVDQVNNAVIHLKATITPMVHEAKSMVTNMNDSTAAQRWRGANRGLIEAVGDVRSAIGPEVMPMPIIMPPMKQAISKGPSVTSQPPSSIAQQHQQHQQQQQHHQHQQQRPVQVPVQEMSRMVIQTEVVSWKSRPRPENPTEANRHAGMASAAPYNTYPYANRPSAYSMAANQAAAAASWREQYANPDRPSPRPSTPDTDAEEDFSFPSPQENQPILSAAHALHQEARQWSSQDNEIVRASKRMATLMAKLSQVVRGEWGTKKDLISLTRQIVEASDIVVRCATQLAKNCTDLRMRQNLNQLCERILTIGTQLKIVSTVKATMLGAQDEAGFEAEIEEDAFIGDDSDEDAEATEILVGNAQNLMQAVIDTVRATEAASIKIRVDSGFGIRWLRRTPWYISGRC